MEAIAKYDFKATADDELSFKRGDILKMSKLTHRDDDLLNIITKVGGNSKRVQKSWASWRLRNLAFSA